MLPPRGWSVLLLLCLSLAAAGDVANREAGDTNADGSSSVIPGQFCDCYGDPLPPGAVARLGTVRFRDGEIPSHVTLALHRGLIASSSWRSDLVRIWDWETGRLIRLLDSPTRLGNAGLAFAPDGRRLVTATNYRTFQLWDVDTGEELWQWTLPELKPGVASIFFTVLLQTPDLTGNSWVPQFYLSWSADGRTLVIVERRHDAIIRRLDAATGTELDPISDRSDCPESAVLARNGLALAAGHRDGTIRMWDTESGEEVWRSEGHGHDENHDERTLVNFDPSGTSVASVGHDGILRICDAATGTESTQLHHGQGPGQYLTFAANGRSVAIVGDAALHLWDLSSGEQLNSVGLRFDYDFGAVSFQGDTLAVVDQDAIRFWQMTTGRELHARPLARGEIRFSPTGRMLATTDERVRFWDPASGRQVATFAHRTIDWWQLFVFHPNGVHGATLCDDRRVWLTDLASGKLLRALTPPIAGGWPELFFADGGKTLVVQYGDKADAKLIHQTRWDVATGRPCGHRSLPRLPDRKKMYVGSEVMSPDGGLLVREMRVEDWSEFFDNPKPLSARLHLYDLTTGKSRAPFGGQELNRRKRDDDLDPETVGHVRVMEFTADYKWLITADQDGRYRVWETATGRKVLQFPQDATWDCDVRCMAVSTDGKLLATGHDDKSVRLWDLQNGEELHTFVGHTGPIASLAFSPDGRRLASEAADASALIWDLSPYAKALPKAAAPLSPKELELLWKALADADAARAHWAIGVLAADPPRSVAFLERRLIENHRASPPPTEEQVAAWIADLDHPRFTVRNGAMRRLEELGDGAETALRSVRQEGLSLEARCRVQELLAKLDAAELTPDQLRTQRAVVVLERLATADARRVLTRIAEDAPEKCVRTEAQWAVERLTGRPVRN